MSRQELTTLLNHVPKELFHSPHTPIRRWNELCRLPVCYRTILFLRHISQLCMLATNLIHFCDIDWAMRRNRYLTAIYPYRSHLIPCLVSPCPIRVSSSDAGNESDASGDWVSHVYSLPRQHAINASPRTVSVLVLGHIVLPAHAVFAWKRTYLSVLHHCCSP